MNRLAHKYSRGAIVASLRIDDTSVAWVNCHLAAGQRHIRQRNTDLTNIFESVLFTERAAHSAKLDAGNPDAVYSDNYAGGGDGAKILPDHEIVFLSGDLNCEWTQHCSKRSSFRLL